MYVSLLRSAPSDFYPRPPGGGRRYELIAKYDMQIEFLSTPSGWRATAYSNTVQVLWEISIHALRVEGDRIMSPSLMRSTISIHALRVEGDGRNSYCYFIAKVFLSTPSGWRATNGVRPQLHRIKISIHALRVEGDPLKYRTPPKHPRISIHALRVEGDRASHASVATRSNFYPRPPGGGRRLLPCVTLPECYISIHALRVEGDCR